MGFDERERVARRSFSGTPAGKFRGGAGWGVTERDAGVPERKLSILCVLVSTRRIEGG